MTYFEKMIKDIGNKDLNAIEKWLHTDFLFVADFELLTRDDWLQDTKKEFDNGVVFLHDNAKCLLETEHVLVFEQKYVLEGKLILSVNTTHFRDGKPWRATINRIPIEK